MAFLYKGYEIVGKSIVEHYNELDEYGTYLDTYEESGDGIDAYEFIIIKQDADFDEEYTDQPSYDTIEQAKQAIDEISHAQS